jgi:REP element-mobilizing transposase RayT
VIYHCISRVVDRRFVFAERECEAFRMFMRMYENFSGCRVLSYCLMSNHFHLLLEVPPMAVGGLSDEVLLQRLSALYSEAFVAGVAAELAEARMNAAGDAADARVAEVHARFTYRMHDLSQFMKGLLIRFTRWFNRTHNRTGTLWEERFKSVIVESGVAARTMAAYIDLNPVRAGMVKDPADYRWSSYGEAVGGGTKGNGRKAREGLVRAYFCDQGVGFEAGKWQEVSRLYRRSMGLVLGKKPGRAEVSRSSKGLGQTTKNTAEMLDRLFAKINCRNSHKRLVRPFESFHHGGSAVREHYRILTPVALRSWSRRWIAVRTAKPTAASTPSISSWSVPPTKSPCATAG